MSGLRSVLFAALPLLLCSGCIFMTIDDLSLKSVEIVDQANQPELAHWNTERREKPYLLLKVEFTSSKDLLKYIRDNSYTMGNTALFCDHPSGDRVLARASWSSVYQQGRDLHEVWDTSFIGTEERPFTYYSFFDVHREPGAQFLRQELEAFDLRRESADLCIDLRGGAAPSPFGYRSNVVRIPKEAIESALQRYEP